MARHTTMKNSPTSMMMMMRPSALLIVDTLVVRGYYTSHYCDYGRDEKSESSGKPK